MGNQSPSQYYQTWGLNSALLKPKTGQPLLYHTTSQDEVWVCTGGFRESKFYPQMRISGVGFSEGFHMFWQHIHSRMVYFWVGHVVLACVLSTLHSRNCCMSYWCLGRSVCWHQVLTISYVQDSPGERLPATRLLGTFPLPLNSVIYLLMLLVWVSFCFLILASFLDFFPPSYKNPLLPLQ